jgi:hypothetical protein
MARTFRAPTVTAAGAAVNVEANVADALTLHGLVTEEGVAYDPAGVTFWSALIGQDFEVALPVLAVVGEITVDFTDAIADLEPGRYRWWLKATYPVNPHTWLGGVLDLRAAGDGTLIRRCDVAVVLRDTDINIDLGAGFHSIAPRVTVSDTPPADPALGDIWLDTSS